MASDGVLVGADDVVVGADDVDEWSGSEWDEPSEELAARIQIVREREVNLVRTWTYLLVS